MKFFTQRKGARLLTGFTFNFQMHLMDSTGARVVDEWELSNWNYRAAVKRSSEHDLDHDETFEPLVVREGSLLTITADPIQTEELREGRMVMLVYADDGRDRQLVARVALYVEHEGEF